MDNNLLLDVEINKTFRFDEFNADNNRLFPEESGEGAVKESKPEVSIRLQDITGLGKEDAAYDLQKQREEAKAIRKKPDAYIKKFTDEANAFKAKKQEIADRVKEDLARAAGKSVEEFAKKPEFKIPKAPELGLGSKISRVLYKIITLGFGETDAYKKHQDALKKYREDNKPYFDAKEVYKREKKLFDEKMKKEYTDKLLSLEEKVHDAQERVDFIDSELEEIAQGLGAKAGNVKQLTLTVNEYHAKEEVIAAGLDDIKKQGGITQDNIFANTWQHKKAVEGINPALYSDKDVDHLANYVVSEMAERRLLNNFLNNPAYAEGQQNRTILAGINNGSAVETMKKDPVFKGLLQQAVNANKPMNLSAFSKAVEAGMKEEIARKANPLNKLKEAQKLISEEFGRKPLSADCMLDIAKYNLLSDNIEKMEKNFRTNQKWTAIDIGSAQTIVADVYGSYRGPKSILMTYMGPKNRGALDRVCNNPKLKGEGKTYSLKEMADFVTAEKKNPTKEMPVK